MPSALYTGFVRHRRFGPVHHQFSTRVAMPLIDLDDLAADGPLTALLGSLGPRIVRFERRDYLGEPTEALDQSVRRLVADVTGKAPGGRVEVLANLRTVGINFNPITLYYCYGESERCDGGPASAVLRQDAPVAVAFEVTNTPWGERATYVAPAGPAGAVRQHHFEKALHVSPFLPMGLDYNFSSSPPGKRLMVRFELTRAGERVLDADLWLRRRPLDRRGLARLLLAYPAMPLRVLSTIYLQAARLHLAGVPFYPHPARPGEGAALENRGEPGRDVA